MFFGISIWEVCQCHQYIDPLISFMTAVLNVDVAFMCSKTEMVFLFEVNDLKGAVDASEILRPIS